MHYKQLDGLRFFAVILVIIHHISPISANFDSGTFGVNLFFVISGFLITEILIQQKIKKANIAQVLKAFFIRRVLRIFPLYYLYILICYFVVPIQTEEFVAWMLTYSVNIWIVLKNQLAFWYFTHLWSLSVEEQFYLFWPFLVLLLPLKRFKQVVLLIICIAVILRLIAVIYFDNFHLFNYVVLPAALDCFGVGALLAFLKTFKYERLEKVLKHGYLVFGILVLHILSNKFGSQLIQEVFGRFSHALIGFFLVGIATTIQFRSLFKTILENKTIMYLGQISYGMYIYHLLIWGSFGEYFNAFIQKSGTMMSINSVLPERFLEFIFITICTVFVSIISYELFEKQVLKLKKYVLYS